MREPLLVHVKAGWAAVGDGWATFATSRSEAEQSFRDAERKQLEIHNREVPVSPDDLLSVPSPAQRTGKA